MSGDLGGTFVARRDAAVHAAVVEVARRLAVQLPETELLRSNASYTLSKRLPAAMGLGLFGPGPWDDAYRWHMAEADFPAALSTALGCEVWCLAHHGSAGGWTVRQFRPGVGLVRTNSTETPVALLAAAKALGTDLETLRELLNDVSWGRGPSQSLGDPSTGFLAPTIAALDADESMGHPGREDFRMWLPADVVGELEEVARRTATDAGVVLWCAWEWAKPEAFEAFSEASGKKRKGPRARPSDLLTPGQSPPAPPPPLAGARSVEARLWLPPRVMRELNAIAEACERGATWAFLTAYRASRPKVLGCRRAG